MRTPNPRSNGDNQQRGRRGASNNSNGLRRVNFHEQDNKNNDTDSFHDVREDNGEQEQPLSDTSSSAALLSLIKEHATPHMTSVPLDSAICQLMANTHQSSNSSADNAKSLLSSMENDLSKPTSIGFSIALVKLLPTTTGLESHPLLTEVPMVA